MELYITLACCFLPLILGIFIAVLKIKDFKLSYAFSAIVMGFAAIFLIILVQNAVKGMFLFLPSNLTGVLISTLLYGLIEESVKMLLLFFLPGKKISCKVFLVVSLIMGCAVGSFETVMYVVTGLGGTFLRLFTAVILHIVCAGLSGLFVWSAKNKKCCLAAFVTAVFVHGIYNFFAGFTGVWWWFSIVTILFAILRCRAYYADLCEKKQN